MKLFSNYEAVKFPQENLIFITHNGFLYYIYNPKHKYWRKHSNAGNDYLTVVNYDEVTKEEIEEIENFYMGKVTEFQVEDEGYHEFVPDDVVWSGKKAICDYLGLKEEETTIYEDDGYEKVYKYKEIV